MARSTKPRKAYRPRYAPGHILLPQQRDAIVMPVHTAMAAFEMGGGSLQLRHTMAAFLNIVGVCAAKMVGTDTETREAIDAAKRALVSSDRRYLKTSRFGFSGEEIQAIRLAITLGDELLKRANSAVLSYAVEFVSRCNARTPEVLGMVDEPLANAGGV